MLAYSRSRKPSLYRRWIAAFVVVATMMAHVLMPVQTQAIGNDFIISDADLIDGTSMSASRIQRFLATQGGFLATYTLDDGGATKRAADIIAEVSMHYRISPKFFLALLEKEMSLISDKAPSQRQLDYALGYGCPSTCSAAYKGFATQLRAAGKRIREDYLPALKEKGQFNGWGPGITKTTIDNIAVTPVNAATAVLYIYNPYVGKYGGGDPKWGANSLFQLLWIRWFVRKYPDGALLRVDGTDLVWLIRNGKRSLFKSKAAFLANYDSAKVITIDPDEIDTYEEGPPILYPEPSLIQMKTGGGVYLLSNGQKRPLESREVLRKLGYNPEEIIRGVNTADMASYPKGPNLTESDLFPTGRLVRSKETGGVAYIDSKNVKHAIHSREVVRSQFKGQLAQSVTEGELASYSIGEPVKFRDGELIASKIERRIYFISNGTRRLVPDMETFKELGFKMKNIIWTNDRSVQAHTIGLSLSDVNAIQQ